jgi:hypothetical protein
MEDLQTRFQSIAATLAQFHNGGSVGQITVLGIIALIIVGPLLTSVLKFISTPSRRLSVFCFERTCGVVIDKIIEMLVALALLALAGIPAFAFAARLLLSLFDRGGPPPTP